MIVLAGLGLGSLFGANVAKRRGTSSLGVAHYAAEFGIAFGQLGTVVTIFARRVPI
ncbi:MAG: hypothetical protein JXR75_07680 [Rhodobacteraceae bacterium]|nr:hypothetical protein [Paracoccaceae bacterium]